MNDLWMRWLGAEGTTPPPLDGFLSHVRAERRVAEVLGRWCATAALAVAVERGAEAAAGGVALLDQVRETDPRLIEAVSRGKAGASVRDRLRASEDWSQRCLGHGVPSGWGPLLARRAERWGAEHTRAWLAAQDQRPPLWLRAKPGVAAELRAESFEVSEERGALRVEGRRPLERTAAYREGRAEIRDLSSQLLGQLAEPGPAQVAWDVCAGRGGKTVQMASALHGRGSVHATDTDERKLAELKVRVRRAGLADHVRIRAWDGRSVPSFGPEAKRGFDLILVDAPCSASGTWRRNPDARLRHDPAQAPACADLQRHLLALAATALRPGGKLVYGTCSWLVEEDEDVAEGLPGFVAEHHLFGPPSEDADTMYASVLRPA